MSHPAFELTDFTAPIYLDFQKLKFWEISLNENNNSTFVRCGKYDHSHKEDAGSIQSANKAHSDLGEAIAYIERHVNIKLSKGYTISKKPSEETAKAQSASRETSKSTTYSINVLPSPENKGKNEHKRNNERPERKDLKQVKTTNKHDEAETMLTDTTIEVPKEVEKEKIEVEKEKFLASPNFSASLKSPESLKSGVSSPRKMKYRFYTNCNDSEDEEESEPVNLGALEVPNTGYNNSRYNNNSNVKNNTQSYNNNKSYEKSSPYGSKAQEKPSQYSPRGSGKASPSSPSGHGKTSQYNSKAYEKSPERGNLQEGPLGKPVDKPYRILLGASTWNNEDPTGWYMSEKLDGLRCFWDGKQLWSRSGNPYNAPEYWLRNFPKSPLDGELWTGRSAFALQKCVSIVNRKQPVDNEWKGLRFMAFDCPEVNLPFKERYEKLRDVIGKIKSPYLQVLEHKVCKGVDELYQELFSVKEGGGEGLMIRDPKSFYEKNSKSKTLLEIKTLDD